MTEAAHPLPVVNSKGVGAKNLYPVELHPLDQRLHDIRAQVVDVRKKFSEKTGHERRESHHRFTSKMERIEQGIDTAIKFLREIR